MNQPANKVVGEQDELPPTQPSETYRTRLPAERRSIVHKFAVAGHEGYIIVGLYDDGAPGELFLKVNKQGSTIAGLMDTIAIVVSAGLQHGVPLSFFIAKFSHSAFEPSGWTRNEQIGYAKSLVDYIFRWLGYRFASNGTAPQGQCAFSGNLMCDTAEHQDSATHLPPVRSFIEYSAARVGQTWTAQDHAKLVHHLSQLDALCIEVWNWLWTSNERSHASNQ